MLAVTPQRNMEGYRGMCSSIPDCHAASPILAGATIRMRAGLGFLGRNGGGYLLSLVLFFIYLHFFYRTHASKLLYHIGGCVPYSKVGPGFRQ